MAELLDRFTALHLHLPGCAPEVPGPLDPDDAEPVGRKEHVIAVECRVVPEQKEIAPCLCDRQRFVKRLLRRSSPGHAATPLLSSPGVFSGLSGLCRAVEESFRTLSSR